MQIVVVRWPCGTSCSFLGPEPLLLPLIVHAHEASEILLRGRVGRLIGFNWHSKLKFEYYR